MLTVTIFVDVRKGKLLNTYRSVMARRKEILHLANDPAAANQNNKFR